ncbi:MAG: Maf family protein [Endomicrobiia bacterium]|nr:Maf family protein [Endomicrobiia bacterium]
MASRNNLRREIILASASPRRREILKMLGIPHRVVVPRVSEATDESDPRRLVKELAVRKALDVSRRLKSRKRLVIAADTVVFLNGRVIGKPRSSPHAESILRSLSGSVSEVYTGVAVLDSASGKIHSGAALSVVTMRRLTPAEIKSAAGRHLDKAGAYAVQEKNDAFVSQIKGDYYNVVGLPVGLLLRILKSFGVVVNPSKKL